MAWQDETGTHFERLTGRRRVVYPSIDAIPTFPQDGDQYYDNRDNRMAIYGSGQWWYASFTTTTSTSTSTTSTSSSTTSTSTSTSSSTTTSTSTSTSTTTTL